VPSFVAPNYLGPASAGLSFWLDQHGDDAADFAMKRSEQLFDNDDAEGAATRRPRGNGQG